MTEPTPFTRKGAGRRVAPDWVWADVRKDYEAGLSNAECCRRHGVGRTALCRRAADEGWRRRDQPWISPALPEDIEDEGLALEEKVDGDLDRIEMRQLAHVAHRRMMRAVLRGDGVGALRWRRIRLAMDAEEEEVQRWIAEEDGPDPAPEADSSDSSDGADSSASSATIIADDGDGPPIAFRWTGPEHSAPPDWLARRGDAAGEPD